MIAACKFTPTPSISPDFTIKTGRFAALRCSNKKMPSECAVRCCELLKLSPESTRLTTASRSSPKKSQRQVAVGQGASKAFLRQVEEQLRNETSSLGRNCHSRMFNSPTPAPLERDHGRYQRNAAFSRNPCRFRDQWRKAVTAKPLRMSFRYLLYRYKNLFSLSHHRQGHKLEFSGVFST